MQKTSLEELKKKLAAIRLRKAKPVRPFRPRLSPSEFRAKVKKEAELNRLSSSDLLARLRAKPEES